MNVIKSAMGRGVLFPAIVAFLALLASGYASYRAYELEEPILRGDGDAPAPRSLGAARAPRKRSSNDATMTSPSKTCVTCDSVPEHGRCSRQDCVYDKELSSETKGDDFDFQNVVFKKRVDLSEAKRRSFDAQGCVFEKGLTLENAEFESHVAVVPQRRRDPSREVPSVVRCKLNLLRLRTQFVDLDRTTVSVGDCCASEDSEADPAVEGREVPLAVQGADLSDMEVKGEITARGAIFESGLSLRKASAARMDFTAAWVMPKPRSKSAEKAPIAIDARSAVVDKGAAEFDRVTIAGEADFRFFQAGRFSLDAAEVQGKADLSRMEVKGDFTAKGATFQGELALTDARVGRLDASDMHMVGALNAKGMAVEQGSANLQDAKLWADADLTLFQVKTELVAEGVTGTTLRLSRANAERLNLRGASFSARVDLGDATVKMLDLMNAHAGGGFDLCYRSRWLMARALAFSMALTGSSGRRAFS